MCMNECGNSAAMVIVTTFYLNMNIFSSQCRNALFYFMQILYVEKKLRVMYFSLEEEQSKFEKIKLHSKSKGTD